MILNSGPIENPIHLSGGIIVVSITLNSSSITSPIVIKSAEESHSDVSAFAEPVKKNMLSQ